MKEDSHISNHAVPAVDSGGGFPVTGGSEYSKYYLYNECKHRSSIKNQYILKSIDIGMAIVNKSHTSKCTYIVKTIMYYGTEAIWMPWSLKALEIQLLVQLGTNFQWETSTEAI